LRRLVPFMLAAVVPLLAFPAAASADSPSDTVVATSTSYLTNRPDSGNHGDWATDKITRVVEIHRVGDVKECDEFDGPNNTATMNTQDEQGEALCGLYYGVIKDSGTFTTIPGDHSSPNAGVKLLDQTGTLTGGATTKKFVAHFIGKGWADGQTFDGANGGASTSEWVSKYFDHFSSKKPYDFGQDWGWTYKTCTEQWVDSSTNGDGAHPDDGDITGKACPAPTPTPTPTPAATPSTGTAPGLPATGLA
jgi:hypothetical protein